MVKEEKPVFASVLGTKEGNGSPNNAITEEDEENPNKNVMEEDTENEKIKGKLKAPTNTISSATNLNWKHKIKVNFN